MNGNKNMFEQIQKNSNISMEEIMKVASSVQNADFSDEETVRSLVKRLSKMANKDVSSETEDKLVETITKNKVPSDMGSLGKMFKK